MLSIKNKKDSIDVMKKLNLNYFPLQVFDKNDSDGIKLFLEKYPSGEYVVRNADKAKGDFFFAKTMDDIVKLKDKFDQNITVAVSYNPYKKDLVLVGDIKVEKRDDDVIIELTARNDKEATHRNIYEKPKFNYICSLQDDRLWDIKGFDIIVKYIVEHNLIGMIVEFAVYNKKIGINSENVVISEIRTNY